MYLKFFFLTIYLFAALQALGARPAKKFPDSSQDKILQEMQKDFVRLFKPKEEQAPYYRSRPLDFYSILDQKTRKGFSQIDLNFENLQVSIIDTRSNSVKSKIIPKDKFAPASMIVSDESEARKKKPVHFYITNPQDLPFHPLYEKPRPHHRFTLHSTSSTFKHIFPNPIHWIAFFKTYLIFMEPSQFYKAPKHPGKVIPKIMGRAAVSFIDLKYLETNKGLSSLPIFRLSTAIPGRRKELILVHPDSISINDEALTLSLYQARGEPYQYSITEKLLKQASFIQQEALELNFDLMKDIHLFENFDFRSQASERVKNITEASTENLSEEERESLRMTQEMIGLQIEMLKKWTARSGLRFENFNYERDRFFNFCRNFFAK